MHSDSGDLLRRAAFGESAAVEHLFSAYRDQLKRLVQTRLDGRLTARVDASDVVQETLLTASRRLREFASDPAVPIYVWLRQIARDRLAELYEHHMVAKKRSVLRERQRISSNDSLLPLAEPMALAEPGPGERCVQAEHRARLWRAVDELSPLHRKVLVMRHLEQRSVAEIAATLGLSEGAVKMRHLRAIQRLRELLRRQHLTH